MPTDKPEKISLNDASYNDDTNAVQLQFSAKFGIATAAEAAGFQLSSTVELRDTSGNTVTTLSGSAPVEKAGKALDGQVPLAPQSLPLTSTLSGTFTAVASTSLQQNGTDIADSGDSLTKDIVIGPRDPN